MLTRALSEPDEVGQGQGLRSETLKIAARPKARMPNIQSWKKSIWVSTMYGVDVTSSRGKSRARLVDV